jgi:hypothetical protein
LKELEDFKSLRSDIWIQLSQLPFTSDTAATKRKKGDLELRLSEVETAISRYSQKRVFVQAT